MRLVRYALFLFCLIGPLQVVQGQLLADTTLSQFERIHTFEEARAVSVNPAHQLYVVDQGTHSIHLLDRDGVLLSELGGPGLSEGQFDEPADIDPTNGLILIVADAGNGRIQRFSSEFLFLEALPVGSYRRNEVSAFPNQPRYRQDQTSSEFDEGRPIAVQSTPSNELYFIDALQHVVVKMDRDRNVVAVIGTYDQGAGALDEPIAMTLGRQGGVFVLDRMRSAVLVYDAFGGYERTMGAGLCEEAVAIEGVEGSLLVALPDQVLLFRERGLLEFTMDIDVEGPIVDIHYYQHMLYVLTATALYKKRVDLEGLLKLADP